MLNFTIRTSAEQDAEAVAGLTSELGYSASTALVRQRIRSLRESAIDFLIVAVDRSDRPVGWLQAHAALVVESGFRVEILGLIVASQTRRSGVGRALVTEAERWARRLGAEGVVVRSNVNRQESHAFYPALGYHAAKTQHVYRKRLAAE